MSVTPLSVFQYSDGIHITPSGIFRRGHNWGNFHIMTTTMVDSQFIVSSEYASNWTEHLNHTKTEHGVYIIHGPAFHPACLEERKKPPSGNSGGNRTCRIHITGKKKTRSEVDYKVLWGWVSDSLKIMVPILIEVQGSRVNSDRAEDVRTTGSESKFWCYKRNG